MDLLRPLRQRAALHGQASAQVFQLFEHDDLTGLEAVKPLLHFPFLDREFLCDDRDHGVERQRLLNGHRGQLRQIVEKRRRRQRAGLDAQIASRRSVADRGALSVAPRFGTGAIRSV